MTSSDKPRKAKRKKAFCHDAVQVWISAGPRALHEVIAVMMAVTPRLELS